MKNLSLTALSPLVTVIPETGHQQVQKIARRPRKFRKPGNIKNYKSTCEACGEYERGKTKGTLES